MRRNSKQSLVRGIVFVAVVAVVAVLGYRYWPREVGGPPHVRTPDANTPGKGKAGGGTQTTRPADANAPAGGATTQPLEPANGVILKLKEMDPAEALERIQKGNRLLAEKKFAEGRAELSKALLSDRLPPATAQAVRETLTELAGRMTFSRDVFDGDPYAIQYNFQPGEVLQKVERTLKLHVPTQIVLKINGIAEARGIRAGQTVKLLLGPFHAVVDKSHFTMDIYLHREGHDPAYVKRLRVGLGKNGSTPVGLWRVALGRKLVRAPWNPPPNAPVQRAILWGEPDYPLGKMGYWLGMEGIDKNTRMHEGYGLHGTDHPESIGQAESLGCIRLADEDIEMVFFLLYEKWSTVRILP
ncbi:MAG TPA: L,D-transpeptidase [Phycisphaerae bacterium]|nr:L,D-transpeptidase [Phycisphaerae bacterium]